MVEHSVVKARRSSSGRCDLSDFCRKFCLTLLAFPLHFLSFSSFFSRIMYAETHRVLPCAQVMRCHGCRVPWLRCGSLRKPQTGGCTNIKNKTTNRCPAPPVSLSPCLPVSLPPCRPAGQGASPCARLRAMQSAKALYTVGSKALWLRRVQELVRTADLVGRPPPHAGDVHRQRPRPEIGVLRKGARPRPDVALPAQRRRHRQCQAPRRCCTT